MTEMVDTLINGEWNLKLPKHRAERSEWYTDEGWERFRADAMCDAIGPGDVVFYAGAEEGEFPALCQTWGAEVALFEPNPDAWPNIKAIWDANELETPVTWAGFVSSEDIPLGAELSQSWPSYVGNEIRGDHGFKELYLEAPHYPQITLDNATRQWKPPTVISFDVEGSEFQVMRGAEQTLLEHKPLIFASIHPEFMFHQFKEYSRDLRNWIIDRGYREYLLDYQHELHCMYEPR